MRCSDCNKFVSFNEPEVEVTDETIAGNVVSGRVRIVLQCAECGQELKDAELDFEMEIDHECSKCGKDEEPTFTMDTVNASPNERFQDKDRHGKPIKLARYRKHYYGADLDCKVTCEKCDEEIEVTSSVEEQARGFNELV